MILRRLFRLALIAASLTLGCAAPVCANQPVSQQLSALPAPDLPVVDQTGALDASARSRAVSLLEALKRDTGAQGALLIVETTQPESIEQYSLRVAESWKLGRKGVDNGFLVLIASRDHRARIETGYGLEGVLPDAVASRVIGDIMEPRFRAGAMGAGALAGLMTIDALLRGKGWDAAAQAAAQAPAAVAAAQGASSTPASGGSSSPGAGTLELGLAVIVAMVLAVVLLPFLAWNFVFEKLGRWVAAVATLALGAGIGAWVSGADGIRAGLLWGLGLHVAGEIIRAIGLDQIFKVLLYFVINLLMRSGVRSGNGDNSGGGGRFGGGGASGSW